MRLPPLREDLDLLPGGRERGGSPVWILHDRPRNRFFRLGWAESVLLRLWSRAGDAATLVALVGSETTLRLDAAAVMRLLAFLQANQLLRPEGEAGIGELARRAERARGRWWSWLLHHYLFFRLPLVRPDAFLGATLPWVEGFFRPGFLVLILAAAILGLHLIVRQWDLFWNGFPYFFTGAGVATFAVAIVLSKVIHELGHAYAAKRHGLRVPTMGVAFLVAWPVLFTDTGEAWKLTRPRARMRIAAAGVVAELGLATFASIAWNFPDPGPLKSALFTLAAVTWVTTLGINLNPFMRYDGYYLLADWLEIPNLQDRSFALGRWQLRRLLLGWREPPPENWSGRLQLFLVLFAWVTWSYRFLLFLGIALLVYHLFAKPLGIFLMAIEIIWFLFLPVVRELRVWVTTPGVSSPGSVLLLALLSLLGLALLCTPGEGRVEIPALLKVAAHTQVFPPASGRMAQVGVVHGQRVARGDPLFTLVSPDLEAEVRQNRMDIAALGWRQEALGLDRELRSQRLSLIERLATARSRSQGLEALLRQLTITAPLDGIVTAIGDGLTPGRWVGVETALVTIHDPAAVVLLAYISEREVADLLDSEGGAGRHFRTARFYPSEPERSSIPVEYVASDDAAMALLDQPMLASFHGGPLAARKDSQGRAVLDQAIYRLHFVPSVAVASLAHPIPGSLVWPVWRPAPVVRLAIAVAALFIRESGF
ncbi:MAG: biotin/lipoyl-binding protein [Magnetococcales bacterium]|nr:biotin/lipoyl-binding protein [Magnetococcales bacterium]